MPVYPGALRLARHSGNNLEAGLQNQAGRCIVTAIQESKKTEILAHEQFREEL
jgi:hypothetical protein